MRKLILKWLFGTDDIEQYTELLSRAIDLSHTRIDLVDDHLKTLHREQEALKDMLKLIEICKSHGIDVDKEMGLIKESKEEE